MREAFRRSAIVLFLFVILAGPALARWSARVIAYAEAPNTSYYVGPYDGYVYVEPGRRFFTLSLDSGLNVTLRWVRHGRDEDIYYIVGEDSEGIIWRVWLVDGTRLG